MKVRVLVFAVALLFVALPSVASAQVARPTCIISASSGSVQVGQTTTLSWQSFNATAGNITSIGSVPLSGKQGVIPTPPKTTYVGTFTGPGGSGVCSITIVVNVGNGAGGYPCDPATDNCNSSTGLNPIVPAPTYSTPNGIVPCNGIDCQACNLAQLGQRIINWLVGFSIPLAAAMFAWAGILYFTSLSKASQVEDAKKIFRNVGIGFVIILCAWLGVQTILKTVLKDSYYKSWNSIQCVQAANNTTGGRQLGKSINDLLNSLPLLNKNTVLPSVQSVAPSASPSNFNLSTGCINGDTLFDGQCSDPNTPGASYAPVSAGSLYTQCYGSDQVQDGNCQGDEGGYPPIAVSNAASGPEGSCGSGYRYAEDAGYAWCQGSSGPDDIQDFLAPGRGGGPVVTCSDSDPKCGDIASAIDSAKGVLVSSGVPGTENGNKACAWAVNQVLQTSGVAPIDGLAVASMATQLDNGRGTPITDLSQAQKGDIIVWQGVGDNNRTVSHVGFCDNSMCTQTSSNSSSAAVFQTNPYGQVLNGVQGRVYRVNK